MFWLKIESISIRFSTMILKDKLPPNSMVYIKEHLFLAHGSVGESGLAALRWTLLGHFASGIRLQVSCTSVQVGAWFNFGSHVPYLSVHPHHHLNSLETHSLLLQLPPTLLLIISNLPEGAGSQMKGWDFPIDSH